ncbi:acyl-CoA thioesterase [Agilicoccus flavus]|uniref:acyl-CoA thioesterase n=1 Tax=Agilicoccus flavus TaxID=2775968 RepID=UPI001CF68A24|nr:acyl-CoA thioesterase II [Agilicoccus flavus]
MNSHDDSPAGASDVDRTSDPGPVDDLLGLLDLAAVDESETVDGDGPDPAELSTRRPEPGALGQTFEHFVGRSQPQPHGRVFGGQVVAQSIVAAGRTVDGDGPPRHLHSLHGYFLRPGDASAPIRFAVEHLRDGRSFSARRVHALQYGRPILSMIFSFQTFDEGLDHQGDMPDVPDPDTLPTAAERLADAPPEFAPLVAARLQSRAAVDIRHVEPAVYLPSGAERVARQSVWFRTTAPLPDDPLIHAAILAYASDYTLLESILRRHGLAWSDTRLRAASLDHSMWFHRPARPDHWTLYTQASPSASGGRGLGLGRMFTRDGAHVATVGQEGMLRLKE